MSFFPARGRRLALPALAAVALAGGATSAHAPDQAEAASPRIVGGYMPAAGEWPWMAEILYAGSDDPRWQWCGGTLVAPQVVVTAAHCVTDGDGTELDATSAFRVVLGRENRASPASETLDVEAIDVHPKFRRSDAVNDVAVLHLAQPSRQTPAALVDPGTTLTPGEKLTVMGWGLDDELYGDSTLELRAVDLPLLSDDRCAAALDGGYHRSVQLCAGYAEGGRSPCFGDSGGPLMVRRADAWRLVGLVSWGNSCGGRADPSVYASLAATSPLRTWVVDRVRDSAPGAAAPAATASTAAGHPPPDLLSLRLDRRNLKPGAATTIHYELSIDARVGFLVQRRKGKDWITVDEVIRRGRAGANTATLRARGGGRRLKPGSYRLVAVSLDADNNAWDELRAGFRVR